MIENPICSRKFHGEFEPVGIGRFDFEEEGSTAVARIGSTGGKQGSR